MRRFIRKLFRRRRFERDMAEEMAFHREMARAGGNVVPFGNQAVIAEQARDVWRFSWIENLWRDVAYAGRTWKRRPAFAALAISTLALGIAAVTIVFSAVNALMWRPLPFRAPDELMVINLTRKSDELPWSYPKFLSFRQAQSAFTSLAVYQRSQLNVTEGEPERVPIEWVGAAYLSTLGLTPSIGRDFSLDADGPGRAPKEVIISDAFWRRRFGGDRAIVGRTIELDREHYDIIGVAPAAFGGLTGQIDVFALNASKPAAQLSRPHMHEYSVIARRRPDVTGAQAREAAATAGVAVATEYRTGDEPWSAVARPVDDVRVSPVVRRSLLVLLGAGVFVLLIACANLLALLLGHARTREQEIAIRLALGAGRVRVATLFLTEGLLLSLCGAAVGLLLAWWIVQTFQTSNPFAAFGVPMSSDLNVMRLSLVRVDLVALGVALATAVLIGAVLGLALVLHTSGRSVAAAANARGSSSAGDAHPGRIPSHRLLIVGEVALAMILLAAAGVMARSFVKLVAIDPGFQAAQVLTLRLNVPSGTMPMDAIPPFASQLVDRVRAVPGVLAAGISECQPIGERCSGTVVDFVGPRAAGLPDKAFIGLRWVTGGWFDTLRVPLRHGRVFDATDRNGAPSVLIVNETAAARYWPQADPIGQRVRMGPNPEDVAEIIGVVGDVRSILEQPPEPEGYLAYAQAPRSNMIVFLRTTGDPEAIAGSVRAAIRDVAPPFPVFDVRTMSSRLATATSRLRYSAMLLGVLAALALALAVVGVYGVLSFMVSQRKREFGIRLALGAEPGKILRLVMGEGLRLAFVGGLLGLTGAFWVTSLLRALLFDLEPSDPMAFGGAVALLGITSALATWIPARRAVRVDPATTLRAE